MAFIKPQKERPEESNLKNDVSREWVPPPRSYPMIRKLPVQKGRNTTGK